MPDMIRRPKVCRACGAPDETAAYREDHCVILCAECHVDWNQDAEAPMREAVGTIRAVFPEPRPRIHHGFVIRCGGGR